MSCYILSAYTVQETTINQFAAMKSDWEKLGINQQIGCINRLLLGTILSNDNKDRLARFVRTVNMHEFALGTTKILRVDHGNMVEFLLVETTEKQPVMLDATEEEYRHYVEDAKDEAEK